MLEQCVIKLVSYCILFVFAIIAYKTGEYAKYFDAYAKFKGKKLIKIKSVKWIFITTSFFDKKEYIGVASFIIQIITNLFFLFYVVMAILDAFYNIIILSPSVLKTIMTCYTVFIISSAPIIGITVNRITKTNGVKEFRKLEETHTRSNDFLSNSIKK